ncbi:MAG TPA: hypothetical protein VHO84_10680 [Syntrophorhabdaceae bacterium]|nr:hypothetical protein [Syntrophorhabdaceae bacterium]
MRDMTIADVEHANLAVLVIGSLAVFAFTRDRVAVFSFAVASAIMVLNFRFLKKILENLLIKKTLSKTDLLMKLPLKFVFLIGAVILVLAYGNIKVVYFTIGLSTVFMSIIIGQIKPVFNSRAERSANNGT